MKNYKIDKFLSGRRVDIEQLQRHMNNPQEAQTDYDRIAVEVCTEFCLKHCPDAQYVNPGLTKVCVFCQRIYHALVDWKIFNDKDRSLDDILDKFICEHNAERLTSRLVFHNEQDK